MKTNYRSICPNVLCMKCSGCDAPGTDKLIFLYKAIDNRKPIEAQIFNDVFSEFEELFYKGGTYKNAMANFKKWVKIAAENRGHEIAVLPVRKSEPLLRGIRNIWSVKYCK